MSGVCYCGISTSRTIDSGLDASTITCRHTPLHCIIDLSFWHVSFLQLSKWPLYFCIIVDFLHHCCKSFIYNGLCQLCPFARCIFTTYLPIL